MIKRIATLDPDYEGLGLDVITQDGPISCRTDMPHGVIMTVDGKTYQISSSALAEIGRFWLSAAVHCGQDIA
jgi:hypothetical protein